MKNYGVNEKRFYDPGSSPIALKQVTAKYKHVSIVLHYAMCIRKHAHFSLPFCVKNNHDPKFGTVINQCIFISRISISNLGWVVGYTDLCFCGFPQSKANAGVLYGSGHNYLIPSAFWFASYPANSTLYNLNYWQRTEIPIAKKKLMSQWINHRSVTLTSCVVDKMGVYVLGILITLRREHKIFTWMRRFWRWL